MEEQGRWRKSGETRHVEERSLRSEYERKRRDSGHHGRAEHRKTGHRTVGCVFYELLVIYMVRRTWMTSIRKKGTRLRDI